MLRSTHTRVPACTPAATRSSGGAPGEDVDVLPIQRPVALIGFGLPDPRALLGGVLGAERKHRGERLVVAEYSDRAKPEVAGVHHPQLRHM